jgi:hypothetical protein
MPQRVTSSERRGAVSSLFLGAEGDRPPLRVGVVLDGDVLPRHRAAILDDLLACDFAGLELAILPAAPAADGAQAPPARAGGTRFLLHDLYARWDSRRRGGLEAFAPTPCAERLRGVARLEVHAGDGAGAIPAAELEAIRDRRLDVILDLGSRDLGRGLEPCARFGVWAFRWGSARHGVPYLRELVDGAAVSGAALEARLAAPERTLTLCEARAPTEPTLSAARNGIMPVAETAHFAIWRLHDLHSHGWEHLEASARPGGAQGGGPVHADPPTNGEMVRFLATRAVRMAGIALDVRHRSWQIGLRATGRQLCDPEAGASLSGFRWFTPPPGHYWADPFIVPWRGRHFLFVEDFVYPRRFHLGEIKMSQGCGVIACAEVLPSGELGPMETVLDTGSHLSYPMVFEEDGAMYLLPESGQAREVALYRATRFPGGWEKVAVLFDRCRAVDTTVHHRDGTWWFFTTVSEGEGALKLLLFWADSLTGRWHYHPSNPISADARNCRGAGPLIHRAGKLLRPSQSNVPSYGHSFALNEVEELTRTSYHERPWRLFAPDPALGVLGTHQYSRCHDYEVVDRCVSRGPWEGVPARSRGGEGLVLATPGW